jgi:diketogulonate reductase-like aldo/keto reductase
MLTADAFRRSRIQLHHGHGALPVVGFATLIPDPVQTVHATKTALEVGFRHVDCEERYRNEEAVGDALAQSFKAGVAGRKEVIRRADEA